MMNEHAIGNSGGCFMGAIVPSRFAHLRSLTGS